MTSWNLMGEAAQTRTLAVVERATGSAWAWVLLLAVLLQALDLAVVSQTDEGVAALAA